MKVMVTYRKTDNVTYEKERGRPSLGELQLSPILEQRSERTALSNPPSAPVDKTKCIFALLWEDLFVARLSVVEVI